VALCFLGGIVGLAIGGGAAWLVARLLNWPVLLEPSAVLCALLFAASIGTFFGYYPAKQAAGLQPIVALRT